MRRLATASLLLVAALTACSSGSKHREAVPSTLLVAGALPTSGGSSGGEENEGQCARTATRIAKDDRVVAVVGPLSPVCARTLIPGLDRAGVAVVTPEITTSGLTHEVPGWRRVGQCFLCSP